MAAKDGVYLIQGKEVRLPVVVRDATTAFASFLVPADGARRLLARTGMQPLEAVPGRVLVSVAGIRYRDNDLGAYDEATVAFPIAPREPSPVPLLGPMLDLAKGRVGTYLHTLPVTEEFTREAGRTIWGFPKFIAEIDFEETASSIAVTLRHDGKRAFTLTVPAGGRKSFKDAPFFSLSLLDGVPHKTPWTASGEGVKTVLGGATLTLGDHPIAEELRSLGLPKKALMSGSIARFRATFGPPEKW